MTFRIVPSWGLGSAAALAAFVFVAADAPAARAAEPNLLPNGSFETSLSGWRGLHATLARVRPGAEGRLGARVAVIGRPGVFSIYASPRPVPSTLTGEEYSARAWVRSPAPGDTVCLRLVEFSGSSTVRSARSCVTARIAWRQFPAVRLTVKESDHQVGLTIYQQRPNRGDRFVVDGAWLRRTAVTMIAAGDIADCDSEGDEATAVVVARNAGVVQTLGDNAYGDGTRVEGTEAPFTDCYEPSWGAFKDRTYPALGNHEYGASDAAGYFAYFGSEFGDSSTGYYSYGLGAWHVVVLNSNCGFVSCAAGQTQEQWLRADLAANPAACTLAVWHHPRFSSGPHAPAEGVAMQPFWQALVDYDADLVLVGHDHNYQRFARQLADGTADPAGVREFVVGTGGDVTSARPAPIANSERQGFELGVLRLRLAPTRYDWRFVSVAGTSFTDSGSTACH